MLSRYPSLCITAALALAACESQPTAPLQIPLKAELTAAKVATARYRNLQNAIADGYVDIDVYMEGMGHHYMNESLLDERFDAEAPELLVYEEIGGVMTLVALEYAVPTAIAAEAPEGFTGTDDIWDNNTTFQLWTLHAWVWLDNPDGIFAPFNPLLMTGEP
jgi:hypothetical protein